MKTTLMLSTLLFSAATMARNDLQTYDFAEAVAAGYESGVLDDSIQYRLQGQTHGNVLKNHGEYRSNKKTNGVGKSDEEACKWVLLSALKSFEQRAKSLGANAVINIKSNYKNREYVNNSLFQCGAGNIMAGVALKGEVVKIE